MAGEWRVDEHGEFRYREDERVAVAVLEWALDLLTGDDGR